MVPAEVLVVFPLMDDPAVICAYFVKQTILHRHREDKVKCFRFSLHACAACTYSICVKKGDGQQSSTLVLCLSLVNL